MGKCPAKVGERIMMCGSLSCGIMTKWFQPLRKNKKGGNPKRRLRNARKQTERSGIGTKSQQALQMQREEMKTERRQISREQRDAEAQRRFEMKQVKKKEKRRGH